MKTLKSLLTIVAFLLATSTIQAQFNNGGFESWTSGEPNNWFTSNIPGLLTVIEQTTDVHSGSAAVKGTVKTIPIAGTKMPPLLKYGSGENGVPVSTRYASISGYFKFTPTGGDKLTFSVGMYKNGSMIGYGGLYVTAATTTYQLASANITYTSTDVPDTMYMLVTICGPGGGLDSNFHAGTIYYADDISISANPVSVASDLKNVLAGLDNVYPNPFKTTTIINYSLQSNSDVQITVFDALGREVATLMNGEMTAGNHEMEWEASELPAGIYTCRLQSGQFIQSKQLVKTD